MLNEVVKNNILPLDLLDYIPLKAKEAQKTRFDQLYDAVMCLAFPEYKENTLERLLGASSKSLTKIWRVIIPDKYKISSVLIRADSYPQAFARACDYTCRVSLRIHQRIPNDLTIRVVFMSEKALRRHLDIRWANRVKKRKQLQLEGREFTSKQINGARLIALGDPNDSYHQIIKYSESKDLQRIRESSNKIRISEVESEAYKSRRKV